jgi:5-methylcytosine-specific restriction endonuclease McrA
MKQTQPRIYTAGQREEARERTRLWRLEHPTYNGSYNRERPILSRVYNAQMRAKQYGVAGYCSPEARLARFALWGNRCWMCGAAASAGDHVKPLCKGGSNWPANIRPACISCNARKGRKWPVPPSLILRSLASEFYEPAGPIVLGQAVLPLEIAS